ncbi:MAG: hypothetical protein OXG39_05065 [Chloroflexi bacterium]|nr:hypothetical protein [Chloroflexota bacterium]
MLLEVALEIPSKIAMGLANGSLERVGGVVRDVTNKQVVMWLREGGQIASNPDLAAGLLKTVLQASSGGAARPLGVAANAAFAARSNYLLFQQLEALTNLVEFVSAIAVLDLAASAISAAIVLERIGDLEKRIEGLYKHISSEFSHDRRVKLEAAIHAATDALNMDNSDNKRFQANTAINRLYEARQHIWLEIETLKGSSSDVTNNQLMQDNILQAMQLDQIRGRCLLLLDETSRATAYLSMNLEAYRETSRLLVHRHLGEHRAVFFHKSVSEYDLKRYLAIETWLMPSEDRLWEILLANRHDFWNRDVDKDPKIAKHGKFSQISLPYLKKDETEDSPLLQVLTMSELLIENYQRFRGYLAEVAAIERLGITASSWEQQQKSALSKAGVDLAEHDDYVLLVDKEWLAKQSDTTAA